MRRGRDRDDACARIAGEQLAFVRIDLGEHDVGRRLERGECLLRRLRIVEEHGRDAVRCDDLRLRRDVPHQLVAECRNVVRGKRGPRDQQREAADQHVHPCEPPRDRPGMTASHGGHSPGTRLFETALATRSSSELIVSPASRADVRLISNRIWLPVDRKSTRLNSSHMSISYAVFCLKKKKNSDRRWYLKVRKNMRQEGEA